jgi:hypothetical protein
MKTIQSLSLLAVLSFPLTIGCSGAADGDSAEEDLRETRRVVIVGADADIAIPTTTSSYADVRVTVDALTLGASQGAGMVGLVLERFPGDRDFSPNTDGNVTEILLRDSSCEDLSVPANAKALSCGDEPITKSHELKAFAKPGESPTLRIHQEGTRSPKLKVTITVIPNRMSKSQYEPTVLGRGHHRLDGDISRNLESGGIYIPIEVAKASSVIISSNDQGAFMGKKNGDSMPTYARKDAAEATIRTATYVTVGAQVNLPAGRTYLFLKSYAGSILPTNLVIGDPIVPGEVLCNYDTASDTMSCPQGLRCSGKLGNSTCN